MLDHVHDHVVDPHLLAQADALQLRYIAALDRQDMAGWLACFSTTDGAYECTTRENRQQDLPMAMMLDDCPARLRDRVRFVTEVWSGTFEDYTTRHFVQRLSCEELALNRYRLTSNVLVAYTAANRQSEILAAGTYEDEIMWEDRVMRFHTKRAVIDTVTVPRYLVYPI